MELTFQKANRSELPYIIDVYNQSIAGHQATADLNPISVSDRILWMRDRDQSKRPIFIILNDDERVGWVSLNDFYGREAYEHTAEISIYIDSEFQHQGIANQVLTDIEKMCPELSIDTIVAYIFHHNTPSINLFKKHSFVEWGHLPAVAEIEHQKYDLDILGKHVNE